MKNLPLLIGTIVGSLVLVVGLAFFFSSQGDPSVLSFDNAKLIEGARQIKKGGDKVTIVEFSDFQCPACKAALPMVESVLQKHGSNITFIYRHFPLDTIHPNARLAAQAAEAASLSVEASASSDTFFKYHDLLFAQQEAWANIADTQKLKDHFAGLAEQLQIDKQRFLETIDSESVVQRIQTDVALGNQVSIQATPTFFVNGTSVPAPQLLTTVEQLVATQ